MRRLFVLLCLVIFKILLLNGFTSGQIMCPEPVDLLPCTCTGNGEGNGVLECDEKNLNDDLASQILDLFTTSPTLLNSVNMRRNQLTRVPSQLSLFTQLNLNDVDLSNNKITIIRSGAFNFTQTLRQLMLSSNLISAIEPGAFLGKYGNSYLHLETNLLTRLESSVFLDVAQQMFPIGPYPYAWINIGSANWPNYSGFNQFDCDCHLTWLLQDHRDLLVPHPNIIINGACANGTMLHELDPNSLVGCPSSPIDVDFEDETFGSWYDESLQDVLQWKVMQSSQSTDDPINAHVPKPDGSSSRYLQLIRKDLDSFAVAEFRSSSFEAFPGDKISFSFWIQSKHPKFNNIEVYMAIGSKESKINIGSLNEFSNNKDWNTTVVHIPVTITTGTTISLVFYGYCGNDAKLDGIAIDDIKLIRVSAGGTYSSICSK